MSEDIEYVEQVKGIAEKLNCHIKGGSVKSLLKYYLLANEDEKSEIKEDIDSIVGFHLPKLVF